MKTLSEIKDEYAKELNFKSWGELESAYDYIGFQEYVIDDISNMYAQEMVKHHLEKAADNAKSFTCWSVPNYGQTGVDRESILNTKIELL